MKSIVSPVEGYVDCTSAQKKAGVVPTLGDEELELKFDFMGEANHDVLLQDLMRLVSAYGIHRSQIRNELHIVFFGPGDIDHSELIYREGSKAVHIKHKTLGSVDFTRGRLPLLRRKEGHVKPKGADSTGLDYHEQVATLISRNNVVGSFRKKTADFQFFVETLGFTLSVSDIVRVDTKESFGQAEIEYVGHRSDAAPPKIDRIYDAFDSMVESLLPEIRQHISTRAKLEWLLRDPYSGLRPPHVLDESASQVL